LVATCCHTGFPGCCLPSEVATCCHSGAHDALCYRKSTHAATAAPGTLMLSEVAIKARGRIKAPGTHQSPRRNKSPGALCAIGNRHILPQGLSGRCVLSEVAIEPRKARHLEHHVVRLLVELGAPVPCAGEAAVDAAARVKEVVRAGACTRICSNYVPNCTSRTHPSTAHITIIYNVQLGHRWASADPRGRPA
jgi:hypothetical protein